jgi:hypothetical protein
LEGDIAAVAAYTRIPALIVTLGTIGGNADQGSGIRLEVSNKNVMGIISVIGDEVASIRVEGDISAVTIYTRFLAATVSLSAIVRDANPSGGVNLHVSNKNVKATICIVRNEVTGK